MKFDAEKATRIAQVFTAALDAEDASAGEACAAASWVFKRAIETAPDAAAREKLRETIIAAIRGPVQ